jgi:nucleoside-diphosphate-sugar epimerase
MLCDIVDAGIAPDFGAFPDRPMEQIRRADIEAARQILGWVPAMSLQRGLEQTVSWYRAQLESGVLGA